jgi:uncharacterized protein with FMN-binding domain
MRISMKGMCVMRKLIVMACALAMLFSTACAPRNNANQPAAPQETPAATPAAPQETPANKENTTTAPMKDGVYEAFGDKWKYGQESAVVTISGGKMTNVVLKRLTVEGQEVKYEEWTGKDEGERTRPNLRGYREEMAQRMIDQQTYQVDSITGATVSCDNWKIAVQRAMDKAK